MRSRTAKRAISGFLTLAFALVVGVAALAEGGLEQKITFYLDGKVGGELIKKGSYKVTIPEAEQGSIEIKVGKKVITAPFTKQTNANEAAADKMTYRENSDGTRTIATITPRGQKFTIVLQETGGSVATK